MTRKGPTRKSAGAARPVYAAPALEKGLDILELLCGSETSLSLTQIAGQLGRSVGELYRMVACLVERGYLANVEDRYLVTTRLFELAHLNPPTHRLLAEAIPLMQRLSGELDQSCHLTVYNRGKQIVVAKVDAPGGMGFSVRLGAELDVLVSASGRVLLAFEDAETREARIGEARRASPRHREPRIAAILADIRNRGFASMASRQVRGLHAIAFPVLDAGGRAIAALTVPLAERIDATARRPIAAVEKIAAATARTLTARVGGAGGG